MHKAAMAYNATNAPARLALVPRPLIRYSGNMGMVMHRDMEKNRLHRQSKVKFLLKSLSGTFCIVYPDLIQSIYALKAV